MEKLFIEQNAKRRGEKEIGIHKKMMPHMKGAGEPQFK